MLQSNKSVGVPISPATAADCLLVIDEEESTIETVRGMLSKLGFEIVPALGGAEALERLATRVPDLILLRLLMPHTDGFELCKKIQENQAWADVPIIFFAPTDDKNLLVRALESGGADYIAEPFDKAELLSRIRTHLMLKTTRDHLKQLAVEKEELLGMISHYLQNHLVGMNMSARLLLDRTYISDDAKLRMLAENIWNSSNQMRVFIKALLANAAVDRGFKIHFESLDFSAAVSHVLRQYEEAARAKEIVLHKNPHTESLFIQADPAAVDQVLDNIISNAIKFSPPRTKVLITVEHDESHVECRIQDQGPGFSEEDKARMFHRYARLSARPTGGEPSTGLGLSIAKRLVQGMKGELACESTKGQGATFSLRFPLSAPNYQ